MISNLVAALAIPFMGKVSRMTGGAKPKLPFGLDQWVFALPYLFLTAFLVHLTPNDTFIYEQLSERGYLFTYGAPIIAYLTAVFSKRFGHGSWMSLPYSVKALKDTEWGDLILRVFFGKDPRNEAYDDGLPSDINNGAINARVLENYILPYGKSKLYWRNVSGLALSGLMPALFTAIFAATMGFYLSALSLLFFSAMKPVGYMVFWKLWPENVAPWYRDLNNPKHEYSYFIDEYKEATQMGELISGLFAGVGVLSAVLLV